MKRKNYLFALIFAIVFSFSSCSTISNARLRNEITKQTLVGNYGTPKDSAIVFGLVKDSFAYYLCQNKNAGHEKFEMKGDDCRFLQPLPLETELKLYYYERSSGSITYISANGIAGIDLIIKEPGLIYVGEKDKKNKNELKQLKEMRKYFAKTQWLSVIDNRIQEIKDEKNK